jgi:glycosyltransferase involved in cell wall biosynthesis
MGALLRLAGRVSDGVVAATPAIALGLPSARTVVVQNFPIPAELHHEGSLPYRERPPLFAYLGGLSPMRGIREMLSALERLPAQSQARLALAGKFESDAVEAECRQRPGWARVDMLGYLGRTELAGLLGRSRAGLVLLRPEPSYMESYPTKLFEYMAVGLPVVASHFPLWREIVEGAGCGLLVDPLDPDAIARALSWVLDHPAEAAEMGARGQKAVAERFGWPAEEEKLLRFYRSLEQGAG